MSERLLPGYMMAGPAKTPLDPAWKLAAQWCAGISAAMCVLVAAVLITLLVRDKMANPLVARQLDALKVQLRAKQDIPAERAALQTQVRSLDKQIREGYFVRRARMERGAYLLLGAAVVLVLSCKTIRWIERRPRIVNELPAEEPQGAAWPVVAGAAGVVVGIFAVGAAMAWVVPPLPGGESKAPVIALKFPSADELRANYPVFRGWLGNGIVNTGNYVSKWDGASSENIVWKSPVPMNGFSSPIVWKDRIFLTGATAAERKVFCYATADGKLLWTGSVSATFTETETSDYTGYAAPTAATDGTLVYAIFGSADIAAFTFDGKRVWQRSIGKPETAYGFSASLTVLDGKVFVQFDNGKGEKSSTSKVVALDGTTGRDLWKAQRTMPASWGSPVIAENGQLITTGKPWVIAYNPADGAELWKAQLMDGDVACTPAVVNGVVYLANDQACVTAIRADGKGDVTAKALWKQSDEGKPDTISPTSDGKLMWTITSGGTLFCFDAADGKKVYEEQLTSGTASPVLVNKQLWITDKKGVTYFVGTDRQYKLLGQAALGENVAASLALANGRIYIRSEKNLYCIGAK